VKPVTRRCPTCTRSRPLEEFRITGENGVVVVTAQICHGCRTVLWENPDSPGEGV
jgi:Fe-S-cluster-containing dehydrogenase component